MADKLGPKDPAEAIAIFRAQVIGPLVCRELVRGELRAMLAELSEQKHRTPSGTIRRFSQATLERWFYAHQRGGLDALRPAERRRGFALVLTPEQRQLLLDVRRENRSASVSLIVRTLEADGRLDAGVVSAPTVRRLYAANGLDRVSLRAHKTGARLRWEAAAPNVLWHADVCHGPALRIGGASVPLRVHAILDDASRYIVAVGARKTERESEMLDLVLEAIRLRGKPDTTWTTGRPTSATRLRPSARGWVSRFCTRALTTHKRVEKWNGFGGPCARAASITLASWPPTTMCRSACWPSCRSTTTRPPTPR